MVARAEAAVSCVRWSGRRPQCMRDQGCTAQLETWGLGRIVLRKDQEPAVLAVANEIRAKRTAPTIVEAAPEEAHQAVGGVERANKELGKQIRALKLGLDAHVVPFSGRPPRRALDGAACSLAAQPVRRSLQRENELRDVEGQAIPRTAGRVWRACVGSRGGSCVKVAARRTSGVWLGRSELLDEHLIATPGEVKVVRSIRRRPEAGRLN